MAHEKSFFNEYNVLKDPQLTDLIKDSKLIYVYGFKGQDVLVVTNEDKVYSYSSAHNCEELPELRNKYVTKIESGLSFVIALTKNGHLYGWGVNNYGQLGLENVKFCEKPQLIEKLSDKRVVDVTCGGFHTIALTRSKEVYAFGYNEFGQLGNNSTDNQCNPTKLQFFENKDIFMIGCGVYHSVALSKTGFVYGWGSNEYSQIGINRGHRHNFLSPISIQLPNNMKIKTISCGPHYTVLLSRDGEIYRSSKTSINNIFKELLVQSNILEENKLSAFKRVSKDVKFRDIGTSNSSSLSVALSDDGHTYVWGHKRRKQIKRTELTSMHETYAKYSKYQITCNSVDVLTEEKLTHNNKYANEFIEIRKLGEGGLGCVFLVKYIYSDEVFAVKKIPISKREFGRMTKELILLDKTKSDFVVKCYDSWIEQNYYYGTYGQRDDGMDISSPFYDPHCKLILHIQMEFCEMTLKNLISKINTTINKKQKNLLNVLYYYIASELFKEVLESVQYLHSKAIIHRDLKPANILLTINGIDRRFIKIADFGLATVHEFEEHSHSHCLGTLKYIAPENLDSRHYGTRADMYSMGKIMAELFNIDAEKNLNDLCPKILKSKYKIAMQFVNRLLSSETKRPSCKVMLREETDWMLSIEEIKNNNILEVIEIANKTPKAISMIAEFEDYFIQKKFNK